MRRDDDPTRPQSTPEDEPTRPQSTPGEADATTDSLNKILRGVASTPLAPTFPSDRFELRAVLGKGGCGQVWRAFDHQLQREVAIKVLTAGAGQEAELLKEAQAQARVNHPHVCKVFEIGEANGHGFIVMQLIIGKSLADLATLLDMATAAQIMRDVAGAIQAAHELGVLHRDLKPGNVMLEATPGGGWHAYVLDFGLARDLNASHTTSVVGTPSYMAPEQAVGGKLGRTTDVYALGATAYATLTGRPPFLGTSVPHVLQQIQTTDPPSLRTLKREIAMDLDTIIIKCLEKDPSRRYPTAAAFADDLGRFLAGEPILARRASFTRRMQRRLRKHRGIVATALLCGVAAVTTAVVMHRPGKWVPIIRERLPLIDEVSGALDISDDGTRVAYDSDREGSPRIYVEPLAGGGPSRPVTPREISAQWPEWTPDGRIVFTDTTTSVYAGRLIDPETGAIETLATNIQSISRCGRGFIISHVAGHIESLELRAADGTTTLLIPPTSDTNLDVAECDRAGKMVVYANQLRATDHGGLWLMPTTGGPVRRLTTDHNDSGPGFHPDGKSIIFTRHSGAMSTLWEVPVAGGAAVQLTTGGVENAATVAPSGKQLFYNDDQRSWPAFAMSAQGNGSRQVTPVGQDIFSIQPTPDGQAIVFTGCTPDGCKLEVRTLSDSVDRTIAKANIALLSRDGREVYYDANDGTHHVVAQTLADGKLRELGTIPCMPRELVERDDGLHLKLRCVEDGEAWRVPRDGTPAVREAAAPIVMINPAPRAGWRLLERAHDMLLVPPDMSPDDARVVTLPYTFAVWAEDGKSLVGFSGSGIERLELATQQRTVLVSVDQIYALGLSPDGNTVYYAKRVGHTRHQIITNFADRR